MPSFDVSVGVDVLPAEEVPEEQRDAPNVFKLEIGGQEFYAIFGRIRPCLNDGQEES